MNDEHFNDTAEPEIHDPQPARGDQHEADAAPEGDAAPPDGDDGLSLEDWQSVGVEDPDQPPADPSGYGLAATGDEAVDAALQQMIEQGDPELDRFAQEAHRLGLSVRQFSHVVAYYAGRMVHGQTTWDGAAEVFGKNADTMLDQLDKFGTAYLSARTQHLLREAPPHPAVLALMEDMMIAVGLQPPGFEPTDDDLPDDGGNAIADKKQLQQLMASQAYRRGDKRVVASVRAGFRRLSEARARGHEPR